MNRYTLLPIALLAAFGCNDDDAAGATVDHQIGIYGEEFVEDVIPPEESDGWRIEFDSLIVIVQDVTAGDARLDGAYGVELTTPSQGAGHTLGLLPDGPHATLDYRIGPADSATAINTNDTVVTEMVNNGQSIRVEGHATQGDRTIRFAWAFETDTRYVGCGTSPSDVDGGVRSLLTIHADHFFFDDLVSDTPNVAFDLIASADADADGQVTMDELAAVDITGLDRYQVGSNGDITDLRAYLVAQSRNLGHIDGEGHCDAAQVGMGDLGGQ